MTYCSHIDMPIPTKWILASKYRHFQYLNDANAAKGGEARLNEFYNSNTATDTNQMTQYD